MKLNFDEFNCNSNKISKFSGRARVRTCAYRDHRSQIITIKDCKYNKLFSLKEKIINT